MKKIWKKLLAVTLAASMTMSMVTLGAMADEDPTGQTQTTGTVTTTNEDPSTNPSTEPSTEPSASQEPASHKHNWDMANGEVTKEPTCTQKGETTYHCTFEGCNATMVVEGGFGHKFDNGEVTTEPTCTEPGVKTHHCTAEGCEATTTSTVPAKGHTWGSAVVTKQPTETEEGVKTYTCTDCGATKTEAIAVLPSVPAVATINGVGYPTLQDAINAAQSGETIVLTKDFTATGDETLAGGTWLNSINAVKLPELTIDLNSKTVDCNGLYGWLHVNSGNSDMDLTVKNGTIKNAANCNQGSAIWAWKTLNLDNVTIEHCVSPSYGGAVFVGSSDETTNVTVTNCTFKDNEGSSGGGLYVAMAKKVDITGTKFINNTATGQYGFGGAFYVDHGPSTVTLDTCVFERNSAPYGGAISSYDNCTLVITACQFNNNAATVCGGAINAGGNEPAGHPGYFEITGKTSFTGNTAQYGGAIYATYLYPSKLENATFTRNNATGAYGGAVYCYNAGGLTVDHVEATSNTSGNCGGAFFLNHAPATITNSTITYNTAVYGGGLYCTQSATTISSSTITENTAAYGGGITNYFDKLTLGEGAEVHNNIAGNMGDDIYSSDAGYHDSYPASLELGKAASVELTSDGKPITGWFIDGQEGEVTNRWSAEGFYKEFDGKNSVVALKAAHDAYYTVTYTDGVENAEIFADQSYEVKNGDSTPAYTAPARDGYTFAGWSPAVADTVTGNVTYTAQWNSNYVAPTYYTVTYTDGVEGEEIFADQVTNRLTWGAATPAFAGTPQREGYEFLGWSPAVAASVMGNATYTAQWREVEPESTESPEVTETPAPTESPEESEDLGDNDTPLTELPETSEPPVEPTKEPEPEESQEPSETEELDENDTPLADVPQTGDGLWLWMTLAAVSAVSLAWISAEEKKGKQVSK